MIAHAGSENTRVFREVAQLGAELESFGDRTLGSRNEAEVGLIFDWDNYWAMEYTSGPSEDLKYVDQIHQYYQYFYKKNIGVDMIPVDADFSKYKIVVAPVLYMVKDGMKEALENFVKNGGILITTFMSSRIMYIWAVIRDRSARWRGYGLRRLMPLHRNRKIRQSLQTAVQQHAVFCAI